VLRNATEGENYASAVLKPAYFTNVTGLTNMTVTFHLPPGIKPEEPRYFGSPSGFTSPPESGFDSDGRIYYRWQNSSADMSRQYEFGASFPKTYVPASSIVSFNFSDTLNKINIEAIFPFLCITTIAIMIGWGIINENKRRMKYLPPKISIEGHGIKRGLTAVEAAILLEEPLDKIMTMILFAVIKKGAALVTSRDPLEINVVSPIPEDLLAYEKDFLRAFQETGANRRKELRDMMVALVRSVSEKMKGFSRRETVDYYRDITRRAWAQVEAADTPEVKSQKYEEVMEWTMLDRDYDGRTRDVFRNQPVYIPVWWGRYDPSFGRAGASKTTAAPSSSAGVPRVPGADFAASVVTGVQTFSSKVVGNITDFTSRITSVTNPPPKYTSTRSGGYRSGGGSSGCACACACACAGCACACAGGGR
jgi:cytochrome b